MGCRWLSSYYLINNLSLVISDLPVARPTTVRPLTIPAQDEGTQTNLFSELFHDDLHSFIKLLFGVFLLFLDRVHDA